MRELTCQLKLGDAQGERFGANVSKLNLRLRIKSLAGEPNNRALAESPVSNALPDAEHLATHHDTG